MDNRFRRFPGWRLSFLSCIAVMAAFAGGCGDGGSLAELDWDQWDSPSAEYRPWVRWWWPGNDVDDQELQREVALLAANGFGGAEVNSMSAALDWEPDEAEVARRFDWGSELFWSRVRLAAEAAQANGIMLDLTVGSGWPSGGPHVTIDDSMRTLLWSEFPVTGPKSVTIEIGEPPKDPFYEVAALAEGIGEPMARWLPEGCTTVEVLAARKIGGIRNPDVWDLTDQVNLDDESVTVLTASLKPDGKLTWDAPAGDWLIVAFHSCPDGQFVHLNAYAEPKEAFVFDHFDVDQVVRGAEVLAGQDAGLGDLYGTAIRGLFVDSFEMSTERFFPADFLQKFQEMRGYDVRPWLPAVVAPGADNYVFDGAGIANKCPFVFGEMDGRIARDYQKTVSDLFIDRYIGTSTTWASARGMKFRIQPYGLHIDSIRAAGVASVPETEQLYGGGSELSLKVMASGAHLYGRNVVSAESLVSAGRDYMSTPTKIRAWLDKLYTSGVNQAVYHGFPFKTGLDKYGETDWHAFSSPYSGLGTYSENISEANPFWPFIDTINRYAARVQYMLRQGTPRADVLVYYPYLGIPASIMSLRDHQETLFKGQFGDENPRGQEGMLEMAQGLFGGFNPSDSTWWMGAVWPVMQAVENLGYTWEWINDDALASAQVVDGRLVVGDASYGSVVVMRAPWMEKAAAQNLAAMAADGLPVVVVGDAPAVQPGFHDYEDGDAAVDAAFDALSGLPNAASVPVVETPSTVENGNPQLFTADGLAAALMTAGLRSAFDISSRGATVRTIARDMGDARIWFIRNPSDQDQEVQVTPDVDCGGGVVADAMEGWVAPLNLQAGGMFTVAIPAWTSRFVICGMPAPADLKSRAGLAPLSGEIHDVLTLDGWSLLVEGDDVVDGAYGSTENALGDWRDVEALKHCSSQGLYQATFTSGFEFLWDVPTEERTALYIDLGIVHGAAAVSINGSGPYEVISEPYRLDVTQYLMSGENEISVVLVPALRNRLVGLGLAKDPTAAQFDKKGDTIVATGLVGPVTLETIVGRW